MPSFNMPRDGRFPAIISLLLPNHAATVPEGLYPDMGAVNRSWSLQSNMRQVQCPKIEAQGDVKVFKHFN